MQLNFCTLFDSNYLSRGLAMYESLNKQCNNFHLYIFCFDNKCYKILETLNLTHATIISLSDFEDEELLSIKPIRTKTEYCWTSTPFTILYIIKKYSISHCTYIDADIYFYASPSPLIEEMNNNSVLITEHRYTPRYDKSTLSGKYCVQFVTFKNDAQGLKVLEWWRSACIKWCYNRHEKGKFGDQKYLDDWPTKFNSIHVLNHLGGGVALWNIQQYYFELQNGKLISTELKTNKKFELIFYHFHYLRFYQNNTIDLGRYILPTQSRNLIYLPYLQHLEKIKKYIQPIDNSFDPHGPLVYKKNGRNMIRYILRKIGQSYNIYNADNLIKLANSFNPLK